jgi:MoxR-like ATPase
LYKSGRAFAFMQGRDFVIPDDIKRFAHAVLEHRIRIKTEAEMGELTPGAIIERALKKVPVPKVV